MLVWVVGYLPTRELANTTAADIREPYAMHGLYILYHAVVYVIYSDIGTKCVSFAAKLLFTVTHDYMFV